MAAYAGIGSRETPDYVLWLMDRIGTHLAQQGFTLRSGGALGADLAFEGGCDRVAGPREIYIPWSGFQHRTPLKDARGFVQAYVGPQALALAEQFHPAWERCSRGARALHARNGYQVLGARLNDPVNFVICWTRNALGGGGTGQALRIAQANDIQIYDLASPKARTHWENELT